MAETEQKQTCAEQAAQAVVPTVAGLPIPPPWAVQCVAATYAPLLKRCRDATRYLLSLQPDNEVDIQLLADLDAELEQANASNPE